MLSDLETLEYFLVYTLSAAQGWLGIIFIYQMKNRPEQDYRMIFFPEKLTRISKVSGHANSGNKIENIEKTNRFRVYVAVLLGGSASVVTIMCHVGEGRQGG